MTGEHGSAGTAGDGYKADPEPHRYQAHDSDWGFRSVCRSCGESLGHPNHRVSQRVAS